jgi:uncharacterized membrane protein YphA (DoxX/SURF4 family)
MVKGAQTPLSLSLRRWLFDPRGPRAIVLVRLAVGIIFISEGFQKFLFTEEFGVGRFLKIGIPMPTTMAPFVGVVELVGGLLVLLGLATRVVCIPLLVSMLVALTSTKLITLRQNGRRRCTRPAPTS